MNKQERRLFPRYSLRIPVRFRIADLSTDMSEHATEAVNVSRYGLLLATRSAMRRVLTKTSVARCWPASAAMRS